MKSRMNIDVVVWNGEAGEGTSGGAQTSLTTPPINRSTVRIADLWPMIAEEACKTASVAAKDVASVNWWWSAPGPAIVDTKRTIDNWGPHHTTLLLLITL